MANIEQMLDDANTLLRYHETLNKLYKMERPNSPGNDVLNVATRLRDDVWKLYQDYYAVLRGERPNQSSPTD